MAEEKNGFFKIYKKVLLVIVISIAIVIGCIVATSATDKGIARLVIWIVGVFMIHYMATSLKVVKANELALLIYAGNIIGMKKPGLYFVPKWFARLAIFPTTLFELDIVNGSVVTKEGIYYFESPGEGAGEEKKEEPQICEKDECTYDLSIYISFPDDEEGLSRALRAGIPTTEEELKKWIDTAANSAVGMVGAQMTWRVFTTERLQVQKEALEILRAGIFSNAGFRVVIPTEEEFTEGKVPDWVKQPGNVFLVIKRADTSKELKEALQNTNIQTAQRRAAPSDAEEVAIKTGGAFKEGLARAFEMKPSEAAEMIKDDPKLLEQLTHLVAETARDHMANTDGGTVVRVSTGGSSGSGGGSSGGGIIDADMAKQLLALWKALQDSTVGGKDKKNKDEKDKPDDSELRKWAEDMNIDLDALADDYQDFWDGIGKEES